MTTKTIKLIVFITLLIHGIGHLQGVVTGAGIKFHSSSSRISWLLKGWGENTNRTLCILLFLITAIAGILTALSFKGILLPPSSWQLFAIVTACISTLCLVLFPNALAMFFNKAGAIVVNLIILYSVLFNGKWPSVLFDD